MIKPYYETPNGKLYHGDCLEIIPKLEMIDMVFTDPFYVPPNMFKWELFDKFYWGFNKDWLIALRPKLKQESHVFISFSSEDMAHFECLLKSAEYSIKSRIVWHYRNAGGRCRGSDRFGKTYEFVFHCSFGTPLNFPKKWDDKRFDVWTIAIPQSNFKEGKYHKFQKPLKLLERIIKIGSYENNLIVDPFMGSGTTAIACERLNRKWVGIEISEEYCEISAKRITNEIQQTKMF